MLPDDRTAAAAPFPRDTGSRAQDVDLVAHIVERHHSYARRTLPYVVALLAKVAGAHRRRNAKLAALCDAGQELADALEARRAEEERDLFPALLSEAPARDAVRREVDRTSRHHSELRLVLARIRWLADDYAVPPWGGRSYQVLMEELEALEKDVLEHVHVQSLLLLPRLSSRCAES